MQEEEEEDDEKPSKWKPAENFTLLHAGDRVAKVSTPCPFCAADQRRERPVKSVSRPDTIKGWSLQSFFVITWGGTPRTDRKTRRGEHVMRPKTIKMHPPHALPASSSRRRHPYRHHPLSVHREYIYNLGRCLLCCCAVRLHVIVMGCTWNRNTIIISLVWKRTLCSIKRRLWSPSNRQQPLE